MAAGPPSKRNNELDSPLWVCTMIPRDKQGEPLLFDLLAETALFLRKERPKDMQISTSNPHLGHVTLRGTCPHCKSESAFLLVTSLGSGLHAKRVGGMQCQGCLEYILAIFTQPNQNQFVYFTHLPAGKPDDAVADEIPAHIKRDFQEALRCLWVEAHNATAEMCRRALESACIDLGIPKGIKDLEGMIDSLESQRKITPHMKEVAHKIRLGGNRGAHPPEADVLAAQKAGEMQVSGPVVLIEKEHAEAIVDFTRQFFQHVYVVPKQLGKYDFTKPKAPKP